jgi:hypothetical protein
VPRMLVPIPGGPRRCHGGSGFTGGHLLHLAVAGCVLNDVYREAAALGIELAGVRVTAAGGFDTGTWQSAGIDYAVEVSSGAPAGQLAHLLQVVDRVAEIPQAIGAEPPSGGSPEPCPATCTRPAARTD